MAARFMISPKLTGTILDDTFGTPTENYASTDIYVGLGIEFDEEAFEFTKEPVSKGFTIVPNPCVFSEPANGIIRNTNAIKWPKATQDWTASGETINYVGLYYRFDGTTAGSYTYELVAVLPLMPPESVLANETMILNPNAIQLKLSNR